MDAQMKFSYEGFFPLPKQICARISIDSYQPNGAGKRY